MSAATFLSFTPPVALKHFLSLQIDAFPRAVHIRIGLNIAYRMHKSELVSKPCEVVFYMGGFCS